MPQRHVLEHEIHYGQHYHQDCADQKDPLYAAEQRGAHGGVERFEQARAVVEPAECCFELRPHLGQQ